MSSTERVIHQQAADIRSLKLAFKAEQHTSNQLRDLIERLNAGKAAMMEAAIALVSDSGAPLSDRKAIIAGLREIKGDLPAKPEARA